MIYGAGCINGFNMDIWWIFPNLMDYGKSNLWSWGVSWVSYASKWAYGSGLSAYVRWSVEHSMTLIIGSFWPYCAKIRSLKEETNIYVYVL